MKLNAEQLDPSFLPADVNMAISTMGYAGNIYKLNGRLYDEDMNLIGSKKSRGNLKGVNL